MVEYGRIKWTANVEDPSTDRVLLLHARGEEKPQDNKMRIKAEGNLWSCSFEKGAVPLGLQQRWTKSSLALEAVKKYYSNKKIEVTEV